MSLWNTFKNNFKNIIANIDEFNIILNAYQEKITELETLIKEKNGS